jgi:hypothetical protein
MQPLATPVCSVDRFVVRPAIEKSPETTWQVEQLDNCVGMWPLGFVCPVKNVVPLWHWEQSPVVGWAESATLNVEAVAIGRVWNPVYCAPVVSVVGAIG